MAEELLVTAAGQIADGADVDWATMSSTLVSDDERAVFDELAIVARIAASHRQLHELLPVAPDTPPQLMPDRTRWGHLDLLSVLGRGSYGTVYRAWDTNLERLVALKLFHGAQNPDLVMREGRMLARVRHENVVTVFGADIIDGVAGLWMEMVHGQTLEQTLRADGPMDPAQAAAIGADVARALSAMHGAGLLHCDIKAQNVVRESGGRVVLMDLGAGRPVPEAQEDTHLSDVAGTPRYMAPELFRAGAKPTRASDAYSLGVLLYYLASAKWPVVGNTLGELKDAHAAGRVRPLTDAKPDLPAGYTSLVARAIDPDSTRRPSSADLQQALSELASPQIKPLLPRSIGLMIGMAVGLAALIFFSLRPLLQQPPATPEIRSIAVLPIKNQTGDPSLAYLADGLSELLIGNLSRVRSFRVPSYTAVSSLRDAEPGADVANKLAVQVLVAGNISLVDQQVRIKLRLINADGSELWTNQADIDRSKVMEAQGALVQRLVARIAGPNAPLAPPRAQTQISAEAQNTYMRGLALTLAIPANVDEAASTFRRTTELAPDFGPAWAELALNSMFHIEQGSPPYNPAEIEQVRQWAQRAIDLDPESGRGYAARGSVEFYYDWDLARAEQTLRFGLSVAPSDGFLRQRLSMLLAARQRLDEGIELALEAQRMEPLVPSRSISLGGLYYYDRQYDRALAEARRALAINPNYSVAHFSLGRFYSAQGRNEEAVREIEQAVSVVRYPEFLGEYARVLIVAGRTDQANEILKELKGLEGSGQFSYPDQKAHLAVAQGDFEGAFAILDDAITRKSVSVLWLAVDPRVDPLRNDPRFARLLNRIDPR